MITRWYSVIQEKLGKVIRITLITLLWVFTKESVLWVQRRFASFPMWSLTYFIQYNCMLRYFAKILGRVNTKYVNLLDTKLKSNTWGYLGVAKQATEWIEHECVFVLSGCGGFHLISSNDLGVSFFQTVCVTWNNCFCLDLLKNKKDHFNRGYASKFTDRIPVLVFQGLFGSLSEGWVWLHVPIHCSCSCPASAYRLPTERWQL